MRAAVALAVLLGAGCSFLTTAAPPSPRCNTSRLSPLIDTTIGVLAASAAAYYVSREEVGAAVTTGATAALFGTSAIVGWSRTSRCATAGYPR